MSILIKFIADNALWVYLFLALLVLWQLRVMSLAINERNRSIFALEKENATTRMNRAIVNVFFLVLIAGGIYYTANILVTEVPLPENTPTPTQMVQLPPTPTTPILLPTPTPTLTPTPRPTPVPQQNVAETPTPETALDGGVPPNCPNPAARITQPGDGATVSGVVQIFGAAVVDNFDYYKIEFRPPGGNWNFIQNYTTPVPDGFLAAWNTDTVPAGTYGFRLVVVDKTGNYPEPCQITLNVVH